MSEGGDGPKQSEEFRVKSRTSAKDEDAHKEDVDEVGKVKNQEAETKVTFDTYKNYFSNLNNWPFFGIVIFIYICHSCLMVGFSRFMGYWAFKSQEHFNEFNTMDGFENTFYVSWGFTITFLYFGTNFVQRLLLSYILL